jgi:hypothetical protein
MSPPEFAKLYAVFSTRIERTVKSNGEETFDADHLAGAAA